MGESFSRDTLLERGGVELGGKGGKVAWKDPDNIMQGEFTTKAREGEEIQELLLRLTKERGTKRKSPTKVVAAAKNYLNKKAEDREDENRVAHAAVPLRSVEESTVVNIMELPNFQIDQATSLLQVKLRNWSTTKTSTARIGNSEPFGNL